MKPTGMSWGMYARLGIGRRLSMLGERLHWHWLTYNPIHFIHFHEHALENAPGTIRAMREQIPEARRWLDVGAGSGAFAAEAGRQGVRVVALEHSAAGRHMAQGQGVDIRPFDLTREPPALVEGGFDLAYCFEVAEHLPAAMGDDLVTFLAAAAPVVVFTAAQPGQGGTGHIHEQPKAYWIERFARQGMTHDADRGAAIARAMTQHDVPGRYLIDNLMVFTRPRAGLTATHAGSLSPLEPSPSGRGQGEGVAAGYIEPSASVNPARRPHPNPLPEGEGARTSRPGCHAPAHTNGAAVPAVAATVVITTRNRKDELRGAIRSALEQDAKPEVLVIDDGSTDGTSAMVQGEFPGVRLHRCDQSRGLIARRNLGAALARGRVIFSIDDDAAFSSPMVVAQTLALFDDPRIGAVAIPFINVKQDAIVRQRAPDADLPVDQRVARVCERFIGTAHALRRQVFLRVGGYRAELVHQGEEGDLCLRLLAAGYVVRMGVGDPIHHHESPRRDLTRMTYYGRRNDVLYAFDNVPLPAMLAHLAGTTLRGAGFGVRCGRSWVTLRGLARGYVMGLVRLPRRRPVAAPVYHLSRRIKAQPGVPLDTIRAALPPMIQGVPAE